MAGMLKMQVIGNLGGDPQLGFTNDGTARLNFTVASNEKKGDKTITTWVQCTVWGKFAETLDEKLVSPGYLAKGRMVHVSGTPSINQYTSQDGTHKASLNLRVDDIVLCGGGDRDD